MSRLNKLIELVAMTQLASGSSKYERGCDPEYYGSAARYSEKQCFDHERLYNVLVERIGVAKTNKCIRRGYAQKDDCIRDALTMLNRNPIKNCWYSVSHADGEKDKFIVYFNFVLNGEMFQISFHSFDKQLKRSLRKTNATVWAHNNSLRACIKLLELTSSEK